MSALFDLPARRPVAGLASSSCRSRPGWFSTSGQTRRWRRDPMGVAQRDWAMTEAGTGWDDSPVRSASSRAFGRALLLWAGVLAGYLTHVLFFMGG